MPDDEIDVALGAALVARDTYDALDVAALLAELHDLGAPLAPLAGEQRGAEGVVDDRSLRERVTAVSELFASLGFHGNTENYYDPKNSLLPDVLARRTGIPITLSIVWCALAKRAGLLARGIAFPGHFLVRVDATSSVESGRMPLLVDPFHGGRILDDESATALLRRALGEGAELHPALVAPASARVTLVRLLTNLEAIYGKRGEHARAFIAIDRIVTLVPDSARMLRERAALALRIGAIEVARSDFARVLVLEPQAPDVPDIEARLAQLAAPSKTTLH